MSDSRATAGSSHLATRQQTRFTRTSRSLLQSLTLYALLLAATTGSIAQAEEVSRVEVIRKVRPATVFIVVPGRGAGSGFVVDREERLVVTCTHVMGNRTSARVFFPLMKNGKPVAEREAYTDSQSIPATVVDVHAGKDLCVLRLDRLAPDAPAVSLAEESPEAGEDIFSIGNPGSSEALWVYTSGTVRQVYQKKTTLRSGEEINALTVETQAPINPGDSGGPVFNASGKLVGVNSFVNSKASLFSACIDVTEVAATIKEARQWLRAATPDELQDRGRHYMKLKLYELAAKDLTRLIQLKPEAGTFLQRAEVLNQGAPIDMNPAFAYSLAIADCVQALRLDPDLGRAYALRGQAFLALNYPAQAVVDYGEAIRLEPEVAEHYVQRGLALARTDKTDGALADFDKAHELDPEATRPQQLRGEVLMAGRQFEKALESFNQAIEDHPDTALLYDLRGDAHVALLKYKPAVDDYNKALELQPDTPVFLTDRAHALNELRQNRAAADDCTKVLSLQPQNARALYERARASSGLGQNSAALEDVGKVLDLPMTSAADRRVHFDALILQGRIHLFGQKAFEQAVADFTRALELDPNSAETLNLRAIAHGSGGDHERALQDLTAALERVPQSAVYLTNRGFTLMKQEKYDDALKDFTAAIEANPNYVNAYEQRAKAYEKLDDKEKAAADTAKAAELKKGTATKN